MAKFVQTGGTGPLNQMCCEVRENKKFTIDIENGSNPENQELYKNDLLLFQKLVIALRNLPISSRVLTETKIGKGVNSIVKDGIFRNLQISNDAFDLVNDWKEMVRTNTQK